MRAAWLPDPHIGGADLDRMTMMAACYNLKRLVYFQKAGIEAF